MRAAHLRREPRGPFDEVVRHARVMSMLPQLGANGALTPEWAAWLSSMDEALERAEVAARKDSLSLSLALHHLREDLDHAVVGAAAELSVDAEATEVVTIRAIRLATRVEG